MTNPLLVGQGGRWVLKDLFRPKVSFQHLTSALASFSGFLMSFSTSRSALGGSSANGLQPDGIAPPDIPLLGCSPPTMMRYRTVFTAILYCFSQQYRLLYWLVGLYILINACLPTLGSTMHRKMDIPVQRKVYLSRDCDLTFLKCHFKNKLISCTQTHQ